jgi:hydroxymethylpyrimidine/phosphomethylpyrimidine kinase
MAESLRMSLGTPTVLVIAGSDSSGGAGLIRDVQTLQNFQVNAACAITSVTAQTHQRVLGIEHCSPRILKQQIESALANPNLKAIKIGMLGTAESLQVVIDTLAAVPYIPVILDPVLLSSSGGTLLDDAGIELLRQSLQRFRLITPNLPELAVLSKLNIADHSIEAAAKQLLTQGASAVLVKGGHNTGSESIDTLYTATDIQSFRAPRINIQMRGTGCALASAIAAGLALRQSLPESISKAKRYVWQQLQVAQ